MNSLCGYCRRIRNETTASPTNFQRTHFYFSGAISSTLGGSVKRVVHTWSFFQKQQRAGRAHGTPIGLRTNLSVNGNSQKLVSSYQTCERTHSHSQNFRKRMSMDNKPSPTPAIIQMGFFPISKCHQE